MKAASTDSPAYRGIYTGPNCTSKVSKKKDVENEEIQIYLSKLKELVPFMPKNRRLSKLEVIQYVIEYICDLQSALETHPLIDAEAVHNAAAAMLSASASNSVVPPSIGSVSRQPLGILPPNAKSQQIPETISPQVASRADKPATDGKLSC